ncbi:MAG: hypothetical protein AAFP92_32515, partial [Bacteroidota bacterium]
MKAIICLLLWFCFVDVASLHAGENASQPLPTFPATYGQESQAMKQATRKRVKLFWKKIVSPTGDLERNVRNLKWAGRLVFGGLLSIPAIIWVGTTSTFFAGLMPAIGLMVLITMVFAGIVGLIARSKLPKTSEYRKWRFLGLASFVTATAVLTTGVT